MKKGSERVFAASSRTIGIGLVLCVLGLFVLACATKSDAYHDIDMAVSGNNFEQALVSIEKGQEAKTPLYLDTNTISLNLDKGFLEFYAGNNANSEKDLAEAERLIEEAFTKSITADIASYIANDNTKEYAGEDFEDIYINVFNALNYYKQGDFDGALVEIRKLTQSSGKLDMLSRKYETSSKSAGDWLFEQLAKVGFQFNSVLPQGNPIMFNNSALAQYLGGLFYLANNNTDSARICFDAAVKAFADNPKVYTTPVPKAIDEARTVPAGKARLNVLAFAGLSPIKEEGQFTQDWNIIFPNSPDLQNPIFKLPIFQNRSTGENRIHVSVGGQQFDLELIEDMGAVVKETYNAKFSNTFLKTYIRVLVKYAAADVSAKAAYDEAIKKGTPAVIAAKARDTAIMGAKKGLDATEAADIRMGRFLPDQAFVGGVNLDPGSYTAVVTFSSGEKVEIPVNVKAGEINLIDAVSLK